MIANPSQIMLLVIINAALSLAFFTFGALPLAWVSAIITAWLSVKMGRRPA